MTAGRPDCEVIVPDGVAPDAVLLQVPATHWPADLLNMNGMRRNARAPWYWQRIKRWRSAAALLARAAKLQPMAAPVRVDVYFRFPTNRRRDVQNLQPTCKVLVDGLGDRDGDAGVLAAGDHDGVLEGPYAHRFYPNGPEHLVVVLTPLGGRS